MTKLELKFRTEQAIRRTKMQSFSRRQFLGRSAMGIVAAGYDLSTGSSWLTADPLGLPIGLQLYTVKDQLEKDFR